jgi:hypothetical protein
MARTHPENQISLCNLLTLGKISTKQIWRDQLAKAKEDNGGKRLLLGEPLPNGIRHGWGSYPGHTVQVGSPRRHGDWRLVWVPKDDSQAHNDASQSEDRLWSSHSGHGRSSWHAQQHERSQRPHGNNQMARDPKSMHAQKNRSQVDSGDRSKHSVWGQDSGETQRIVDTINETLSTEKERPTMHLPLISRAARQDVRSHSVPLSGPWASRDQYSASMSRGVEHDHHHVGHVDAHRSMTYHDGCSKGHAHGHEAGDARGSGSWQDAKLAKDKVKQLRYVCTCMLVCVYVCVCVCVCVCVYIYIYILNIWYACMSRGGICTWE